MRPTMLPAIMTARLPSAIRTAIASRLLPMKLGARDDDHEEAEREREAADESRGREA